MEKIMKTCWVRLTSAAALRMTSRLCIISQTMLRIDPLRQSSSAQPPARPPAGGRPRTVGAIEAIVSVQYKYQRSYPFNNIQSNLSCQNLYYFFARQCFPLIQFSSTLKVLAASA